MRQIDYVNIASIMKNKQPELDSIYHSYWEDVLEDLATYFESQDKQFDTERFFLNSGCFTI